MTGHVLMIRLFSPIDMRLFPYDFRGELFAQLRQSQVLSQSREVSRRDALPPGQLHARR